jgi:hypothetical protein
MFIYVSRLPGDPRRNDVLRISFQEIPTGYYDRLTNLAIDHEELRSEIDALRINGKITWGRYNRFIRKLEAAAQQVRLEDARLDIQDAIKYGKVWELVMPVEDNVATACIGSTRIRDRLAKEKKEKENI